MPASHCPSRTMGRKEWSGNITNCTTYTHACISLSTPSQCSMGKKGQSGNIPNCTTPMPAYHCPSHPSVPWNRVAKLYHPSCLHPTTHPIPMYHGIEWPNYHPSCLHPTVHPVPGIEWSNCTTPRACIPLPIPYHGTEGMEWEHHKLYHIHSCLHFTVHPIPMCHGKEGTEWEHPKLYQPASHCPSCTMGRKEWSGNITNCTTYTHACISLSTLSQCAMGRKGQSGNIPNCTTPKPVHPIPMYHGIEGPNCTTPRACIPLPIPSQCTMEYSGQTVPPLVPASHCPSRTMGRKEWSGNITNCTTYTHACISLSTPSQCAMGKKGQSGNIPNCTNLHPTAHPVP